MLHKSLISCRNKRVSRGRFPQFGIFAAEGLATGVVLQVIARVTLKIGESSSSLSSKSYISSHVRPKSRSDSCRWCTQILSLTSLVASHLSRASAQRVARLDDDFLVHVPQIRRVYILVVIIIASSQEGMPCNKQVLQKMSCRTFFMDLFWPF